MYDVAIVKCDDYDYAPVESAVREAVENAGGLGFVKSGMRVAVKLNLVSAMKPDRAATVHPSVVCAVVKMLRERGAEVVLGDSPGGIYTAPYLNRVYDECGLREAEALGAKLNDDFSQTEAHYPEAKVAKTFQYTAYLKNADAIIDLSKLKSHGMMAMTNAVKNFFGSIPGTIKPEYHYRYPKAEDFANLLVDLYEYSAPALCITDAVVGMEGNGPTQGTPRKIGCIMAARSGHALDLAASEILGLGPARVPTLKMAMERGLVPDSVDKLSIYGSIDELRMTDFVASPAQESVAFLILGDGALGRAADAVAKRVMTPFPKLERAECVGCGKCANICPAKAIRMVNGKPKIDRAACIHCFCCQEFCPKGAMKVGRHAIMRLLGR